MTELKPCPFCGAAPEFVETHLDHWHVNCRNCLARNYGMAGKRMTKENAMLHWNTRYEAAKAEGQPVDCMAAFENWYGANPAHVLKREANGKYADWLHTEKAWLVWKAAWQAKLESAQPDELSEDVYVKEMIEKHADRADMFQPETEVIETRWVKLMRAPMRESGAPEKSHDAVRLGLYVCPRCGSGDVRWCGISVRPYCSECGHWGQSHHGTAEEAIKRWNSNRIEAESSKP